MNKIYYSAVIFDVDGLMLDTERIASGIWKQIIHEHGHVLKDELYYQLIGRTCRDTEDILKSEYGDNFPVTTAYNKRIKYFEDYAENHGIPQKPGLDDLLQYLDSVHARKAVATSTSRKAAELKMIKGLIRHHFDVVVCGDEVANGKPEPDIFLRAAELLGVIPDGCVVLEDSEAGIRAAHKAGMIPIMVPDMIKPSPEVQDMTYAIADSLRDVKDLLHTQFILN